MKFTGIHVAFWHSEPHRRRDFAAWADARYRPALHGGVPGVYHSQHWYAPPDYATARVKAGGQEWERIDPTVFPNGAGQHLTALWLERSAYEVRRAAQAAYPADRKPLWSSWLALAQGWAKPGLDVPLSAVPLLAHQGIFVSLGEVIDEGRKNEWLRWFDATHAPDVLSCDGVLAIFQFLGAGDSDRNVYLNLYYLSGEPAATMAGTQSNMPRWKAQGRVMDLTGLRRTYMSGCYRTATAETVASRS
ncbi:MAG: hypothetical protein HYX97_06045 [Chloroflexi bacterium]|nr:hypothetical protein [Chloroflexota bacterium]